MIFNVGLNVITELICSCPVFTSCVKPMASSKTDDMPSTPIVHSLTDTIKTEQRVISTGENALCP
jgi:hypothetical protein